MTITLELSAEQERRLREGTSHRDAETVRQVLLQAVDSKVEHLLGRHEQPSHEQRRAILDELAAELSGTPVLSDEAVSRAGIYGDHP